jgi:hypothetical protein
MKALAVIYGVHCVATNEFIRGILQLLEATARHFLAHTHNHPITLFSQIKVRSIDRS